MVVGGNRGGRSNCMPGLSNRMILQPCSFAGTGGSLMVGVGSGGERGLVVCMGGPVQIACSGVELMIVQPSSSPQRSRSDLLNRPFISQLSTHVSLCHHGCYWFLI